MPPKKLREGFLVRRSDIINLTIGVCWLGTTIWGIAVFKQTQMQMGLGLRKIKIFQRALKKTRIGLTRTGILQMTFSEIK